MEKAKVRMIAQGEKEKVVIIEGKYLELLDMIYTMFGDGDIFDYFVLPNEEKVVDFTE